MKTKFLIPAFLLATLSGFSQTLNVHKTDGSVTSINLSDINKITFTLSTENTFTDLRDNHIYNILTIGDQIWMVDNLAYLPSVSPSNNGSETESRYYVYNYQGTSISSAKDSVNYSTYGVLYNWPAASTACPSGWHLPSDMEWTSLRTRLGADSGIKAKSTSGWFDNKNGDGSSGFNGLPAGCRSKDDTFKYMGSYTYFWSTTEVGLNRHWNTYLSYGSDDFTRDNREPDNGFSIRCIQDSH
jgi:uncharacterized protein (TIGR02145 family)